MPHLVINARGILIDGQLMSVQDIQRHLIDTADPSGFSELMLGEQGRTYLLAVRLRNDHGRIEYIIELGHADAVGCSTKSSIHQAFRQAGRRGAGSQPENNIQGTSMAITRDGVLLDGNLMTLRDIQSRLTGCEGANGWSQLSVCDAEDGVISITRSRDPSSHPIVYEVSTNRPAPNHSGNDDDGTEEDEYDGFATGSRLISTFRQATNTR